MGRSSDDGGRARPLDNLSEQSGKEFDTSRLDPELAEQLNELKIGARELFLQATEQTRMAIVVVDPHAADQPIVYVNRAFVEVTGYSRDDVVGRNCRLLQGEGTDSSAVNEIRQALEEERVAVVQLLNYKKDGTPFWNSLHIGPVYDAEGKLAYYYGSQWDVTNRVEAQLRSEAQQRAAMELQHRVHNLFAVMSAIVRLSARGAQDVDDLSDKIVSRINALGRAHRASIGEGGIDKPATSLRALVEGVLEPYRNAKDHEIVVSGDDTALPARDVTPLGIALHELATNAVKYGALGPSKGTVSLSWNVDDGILTIDWVERITGLDRTTDSVPTGKGSGSRIVDGLLKSLNGTIESEVQANGYRARITLPLPQDE